MKNIERSLVVAGLALLIATGQALAQATDPVVGTWELNLAKSAFTPGPAPKSETRTYEASGSDFKLMVEGHRRQWEADIHPGFVQHGWPGASDHRFPGCGLAINQAGRRAHD